MTNPYLRSEGSDIKKYVDIVFIDFGNESSGVFVEDLFALPTAAGNRFAPLLDPAQNPGFALGPLRPVAGGGRAESPLDDLIVVRLP